MPSQKPFLSFVVDKELLDKIDEYRFKYRFESRAETIRFLIQKSIDEDEPPN